jgi:hypothetical protein
MVGFYRTGSFFTWETLGGMTIGGTGGIVGYLTIGTLVGAAKISMISSGVATLALDQPTVYNNTTINPTE